MPKSLIWDGWESVGAVGMIWSSLAIILGTFYVSLGVSVWLVPRLLIWDGSAMDGSSILRWSDLVILLVVHPVALFINLLSKVSSSSSC